MTENNLLNHRTSFYLDASLVKKIKEEIASKKVAGDIYKYGNISDFFRSSLLDFKNDKKSDLTYLDYKINKNAVRERFVFRIPQEIKDFIGLFPDRESSLIVEKILGTYQGEI